MKLPKPCSIYCYKTRINWTGVVWSDKSGWSWYLKDPDDKLVRLALYWSTKTEVLEMMMSSFKELSGTKDVTVSDSIYIYHTTPPIEIRSIRSKWHWKCGKQYGEEKSKKIALEKACQCLEGK